MAPENKVCLLCRPFAVQDLAAGGPEDYSDAVQAVGAEVPLFLSLRIVRTEMESWN